MANKTSYIGATLGFAASATPATYDKSGYEALTYVTAGVVVSISEIGDTSSDISIDALDGRVFHVNGPKNMGEISVTIIADSDIAGQTSLKGVSNSNDECTFRVIDPDGEYIYFTGKVANFRDMARSSTSYKGYTFAIRGNTAELRTTAP